MWANSLRLWSSKTYNEKSTFLIQIRKRRNQRVRNRQVSVLVNVMDKKWRLVFKVRYYYYLIYFHRASQQIILFQITSAIRNTVIKLLHENEVTVKSKTLMQYFQPWRPVKNRQFLLIDSY